MRPQSDNSTAQQENRTAEITAELVRRVSERVYELWRDDLRVQRERQRTIRPRWQQR